MQERGKRYDPLIFPANSPKNSRNGIGYIHRNPTKGIESSVHLEFRKDNLRISYIHRNPTKGIESYSNFFTTNASLFTSVTFTEIPQRELRAALGAYAYMTGGRVTFTEIPQRELRADYVGVDLADHEVELHSPKSHKGN